MSSTKESWSRNRYAWTYAVSINVMIMIYSAILYFLNIYQNAAFRAVYLLFVLLGLVLLVWKTPLTFWAIICLVAFFLSLGLKNILFGKIRSFWYCSLTWGCRVASLLYCFSVYLFPSPLITEFSLCVDPPLFPWVFTILSKPPSHPTLKVPSELVSVVSLSWVRNSDVIFFIN